MNLFRRIFAPDTERPEKHLEAVQDALDPDVRVFGFVKKRAVHLRGTCDEQFSKLGGMPNLPCDVDWPQWQGRPLAFLAQIDLEDMPFESFLPKSGALYFFFDTAAEGFGRYADIGSWRVIYWGGDVSLVPERPSEAPAPHAYVEKFVTMSTIEVFPDESRILGPDEKGESEGGESENASEEEREPDSKWDIYNDYAAHQLLGYPASVQSDDMELECEMNSRNLTTMPALSEVLASSLEWRLLLQIDTDLETEMHWVDRGLIYFWIKEKDAREGLFDRVWLTCQFY